MSRCRLFSISSAFPFMTDRESARQCSLKDAVCVVYGATIPKHIPGRCSWNTLQTAAQAVADVRLYAQQAQERLPMESANGIRKAAVPALHGVLQVDPFQVGQHPGEGRRLGRVRGPVRCLCVSEGGVFLLLVGL